MSAEIGSMMLFWVAGCGAADKMKPAGIVNLRNYTMTRATRQHCFCRHGVDDIQSAFPKTSFDARSKSMYNQGFSRIHPE
jgi:hypothetical protein